MDKLARFLSQNDNDKYEIYIYLLKVYLNFFFVSMIIFIIAYFLHILYWSLIAGIISWLLRAYTGGAHSESQKNCTLLSIFIIILMGLLVKFFSNIIISIHLLEFNILIISVSMLIIYFYAPADTPEKPIISLKFKQELRKKAFIFESLLLLIVLILFYFNIYFNQITLSIILGIMWQTFTIVPIGYFTLKKLDEVINKFKLF